MKLLLTFCILLTALTMNAQESLGGIWNMGQDNTKIEITQNNGIYEGKVFYSDNPNAKKGSLILKEVKLTGGKWAGKLYSPKNKQWFDAVLVVKGKQLLVTVNSGWMSKTVKWAKE